MIEAPGSYVYPQNIFVLHGNANVQIFAARGLSCTSLLVDNGNYSCFWSHIVLLLFHPSFIIIISIDVMMDVCYNNGVHFASVEVPCMKSKQPPFEITHQIIDSVAQIAELVGRLTAVSSLPANPTLRRSNRIRTIHGSLAIEQNTLSLEQVTAVLGGKHVLAPPKDIAEVKNAYEIYERLDELDPSSVDDLLLAHGIMMYGLIEEAGVFRSRPVGVVDSQGRVVHFGTLPQYVPGLIADLLDWTRNSDLHMLIRSCVFHYEFELIHPFADGNGRVGRLWHTLLLSRWNPAFAWLPVESVIHDRQQGYYDAINISNNAGESTAFIEFMLSAIQAALTEAISAGDGMRDEAPDKETVRWRQIETYLKSHDCIRNADVRTLCGVSAATANRILAGLVANGHLVKVHAGKYWAYRLP